MEIHESTFEALYRAQKEQFKQEDAGRRMSQFTLQFPEVNPSELQQQDMSVRTEDHSIHYLHPPTDRVYSYNERVRQWEPTTLDGTRHAYLFTGAAAETLAAQMKARVDALLDKKRRKIQAPAPAAPAVEM